MMRMIAAVDAQLGIATDQGIPWNLPTDQQFFVDSTRDGVILMGFGTYVEFDSPMHSRTNYVATRQPRALQDGFVPVIDVDSFLNDHAGELINNIGGAGLFASTLAFADELLLTRIEGAFGCTKFFPQFNDDFALASQSEPVTENGSTFTFEVWHRHPGS